MYRGATGGCHQRPFVFPGRVGERKEPEGAQHVASAPGLERCAPQLVFGEASHNTPEEEQLLPVPPHVIGQARLWRGPLSPCVPISVYFILRQNG